MESSLLYSLSFEFKLCILMKMKTFAARIWRYDTVTEKALVRRSSDKVIAGVCGALARRFDLPSIVVRLFFFFLFVGMGTGLILYIILALVIPLQD